MKRREFLKTVGLTTTLLSPGHLLFADEKKARQGTALSQLGPWPVLKFYDAEHLVRIAMPIGGIGTGSISLGGRGDFRDWEVMNRPAKGFTPVGQAGPFFALYLRDSDGQKLVRAIEGPIDTSAYEGSHGSTEPNHGLPRFQECAFAAAYPLGQVRFTDPEMPVDVRLESFNPLVPGDVAASGWPVAVLRYALHNKTDQPISASVCGTMPNFIGVDGWSQERDWKGDPHPTGAKGNRNAYKEGKVRGIFMNSQGIDPKAAQWGTLALVTTARNGTSYRTGWPQRRWGGALLDFWEDLSDDGRHEPNGDERSDMPMASLAVQVKLPPRTTKSVTFIICWHFPNRYAWAAEGGDDNWIGNYYTSRHQDAWDVAESFATELPRLEQKTIQFVSAFCGSDLPVEVKEAALFNLSTLKTQTCFRTPDGNLFGWEGCGNQKGCCHGSCTHVWNYEQSVAFLFGDLAISMRRVEFAQATNDEGMMSFRVDLPLGRAKRFGKAAADGQLGCILKIYRDWQLSGDDKLLKQLWPSIKRTLQFCWIEGGWDADRDGVMEGCQHNTMDVEYFGPNPQMGFWYLGALRAAAAMADHLNEKAFARQCQSLFANGSRWMDENLFNGEYYHHQVRLPEDANTIAASLRIGMGASDVGNPDYQLGSGCLVDQMVGQVVAHICGLGHLTKAENIRRTLRSIMKHNQRSGLHDHFNTMRSFALGDEKVLVMASFPSGRPEYPFPYFTEAMTGFEYTAAIGMLQEGQTAEGLTCIRNIRERYDGLRRSPFDEAECGHHYARAMIAWAAALALTGFHYSAVDKVMTLAANSGLSFWSNGYAWGTCEVMRNGATSDVCLEVLHGTLALSEFRLRGLGAETFDRVRTIRAGDRVDFTIKTD